MASGGVAAAICRRASSLFITPTSEAVTAFSVFHRSYLLSSLLSYLTAYKAVGAARCGGSRARAQRPLKTLAALDLDPPPRGGSSSVVQVRAGSRILAPPWLICAVGGVVVGQVRCLRARVDFGLESAPWLLARCSLSRLFVPCWFFLLILQISVPIRPVFPCRRKRTSRIFFIGNLLSCSAAGFFWGSVWRDRFFYYFSKDFGGPVHQNGPYQCSPPLACNLLPFLCQCSVHCVQFGDRRSHRLICCFSPSRWLLDCFPRIIQYRTHEFTCFMGSVTLRQTYLFFALSVDFIDDENGRPS
jgi:hypothetical protein